jgi:large subunit ribosomal protein L24
MNLKTGDKVIIIAGKNKGNTGKISKILKRENKVIVEGANIIKKHLKPDANNQSGGIVEQEAPIHISNVMLIDPKNNKRTRVGFDYDKKNNKIRIARKSKEKID